MKQGREEYDGEEFKQTDDGGGPDNECTICFETLDLKVIKRSLMKENVKANKVVSEKDLETQLANFKTFKLPCGHECFHAKCIKDWL